MSSALVQPGGDYNLVPYESHAYPQSAPTRLFALASLFGIEPPALETASILELGCASGGNIIPLAARFPDMRLLGIDLTPRHVADGQARIKELGLTNIEIRQGDVTALDLPDGSFDCIIAHGIYSWVPPEARDAILAIAGRKLSPNGVAYVSYNVLPGWHMRGIIRDLMLFHAGEEGPAGERIAKARWVLDNVARMSHAGSSYGTKLREEAGELAKANDSYILGEFLAPENAPCYFRDFNTAAQKHGLVFLGEADIETSLPETHGPEIAKLIRTMSASQLVPLEQYVDFLMGRTFRQTLLMRAEQADNIKRQLEPERLDGLHFSGKLAFDAEASGDGKYVFKTPHGRTVTTVSEVARQALDSFVAAFPETRSQAELLAQVAQSEIEIDAAGEAAVRDTLFQMVVAGIIKVSCVPVRVGRADGKKLKAWPLARADAAAKRPSTANLLHETSPIDAVTGVLIPNLDGTKSRMSLCRLLSRAVRDGHIDITDDKSGLALGGKALEAAVAEHVDLAIARLADAALLEPETD